MKAAVAVLIAVLCLARPAHAYRPFDGTDADVAEFGAIEIEAGPIYYIQTGPVRQLELPNLVLNYGFLPRWEVVLEGINRLALDPSETIPQESITDTGLFFKHVLKPGVLQSMSGFSLATEFGLLLPTWHDGPNGVGGWASLLLSQRWGPVTAHFNAAFELTLAVEPGGVENIILEGPEKWPVRPVCELLGEEVHGGDYTVSGLVGAIWQVSEALALDLALRAGTSAEGQIREVRAGFSWSIPLGHREAQEQH